MFHLHRWKVVRRAGRGNTYEQCRGCPERRIIHRDRNRPMDHSWLERGTFHEMPTRGPGPAGVSTSALAAGPMFLQCPSEGCPSVLSIAPDVPEVKCALCGCTVRQRMQDPLITPEAPVYPSTRGAGLIWPEAGR